LKLTKSELLAVSHQPKDMIKSCNITGSSDLEEKPCKVLLGDQSPYVFSPTKGICYMINFSPNSSESLTFDESNTDKGLRLDVDIEGKFFVVLSRVLCIHYQHILIQSKKGKSGNRQLVLMPSKKCGLKTVVENSVSQIF